MWLIFDPLIPLAVYKRLVHEFAVESESFASICALLRLRSLILYQSWLVRKQGKGSPERCHLQKRYTARALVTQDL